MQVSLGKITCVTPGVPIRATINVEPDPDKPYYVHAYSVQRLRESSGNAYVSLSPVDDRTDLMHILGVLSKSEPAFSAGITTEVNGTNMSNVYIDFDHSGDSVIIAALVS